VFMNDGASFPVHLRVSGVAKLVDMLEHGKAEPYGLLEPAYCGCGSLKAKRRHGPTSSARLSPLWER
jgi:hypothetical protein